MRYIVFLSVLLMCCTGGALADETYRWDGKDFVFCFVTDDGARCNIGWAKTAAAKDFSFTVAVNCIYNSNPNYMSGAEAHQLAAAGIEIGQHGYSHGFAGLESSCSIPPRGSLLGYLLCSEPSETIRMQYLAAEIERDSVATWADMPAQDVRVVAYPRHRHNRQLIDLLVAEGYLGARTGGRWNYNSFSYGDFTVQARNSWDGGISLYRVPTWLDDQGYFGNHSADPPVHKTYAEFLAAAQPVMDTFRQSGGILVLFTHHFGDDDETWGQYNYGSGGVTAEELGWMVDLVRANNGAVMSFGDAVQYYRAHSDPFDLNGDLVWMTGPSPVVDLPAGVDPVMDCQPNPFNPTTNIAFHLPQQTSVHLSVFSCEGRRVRTLINGEVRAEGHHTVAWNGRDDAGRCLGSGTYLVHLVTDTGRLSQKVALLK